jgi:signal peptidase I
MRLLSELRENSKQSMAAEVLRQTGFLRIRVLGESMLPSIWPGDMITIRQQSPNEFLVGDIGLFRKSERFFAHRIEKIVTIADSLHFITRGDSVLESDPCFHSAELLGKVVAIQPLQSPAQSLVTRSLHLPPWVPPGVRRKQCSTRKFCWLRFSG